MQFPWSEQSFGQSDVRTSVSSSMLPSVVFLNEEMLLKMVAMHDVSNAAKLLAAHAKSSVAFEEREKICFSGLIAYSTARDSCWGKGLGRLPRTPFYSRWSLVYCLNLQTASNAQVAARLLQCCCSVVVKSISRCARIACFRLIITSLLNLSIGLMQVDCQNLLITTLIQVFQQLAASMQI